MATKIQFRRDTSANWTTNNPVLSQGEIGLDLTNNHFKIGNGTSAWNSLSYWSEGQTYSQQQFTATAGQTTFSVTYTGNVDVLRNGFTLSTSDYTASNGTSVVLNTLCDAGDLVIVKNWRSFSVANALQLTGGTLTGNLTVPSLNITGTDALYLPSGTTSERPLTPLAGAIRYNTSNAVIEGYNGTSWANLTNTGIVVDTNPYTDQIDIDVRVVYTNASSFYSKMLNNSVSNMQLYVEAFKNWFLTGVNSSYIDPTLQSVVYDNVMRSYAAITALSQFGQGFDWIFDKWLNSSSHRTWIETHMGNGLFANDLTNNAITINSTTTLTATDLTLGTFGVGDFIILRRLGATWMSGTTVFIDITLTTDSRTVILSHTASTSTKTYTPSTGYKTYLFADGTAAKSKTSLSCTIDSNVNGHDYSLDITGIRRPVDYTNTASQIQSHPSYLTTDVEKVSYDLSLSATDVSSFAGRMRNSSFGSMTLVQYLTALRTLLNTQSFVDTISLNNNIFDNLFSSLDIANILFDNTLVFYTSFININCENQTIKSYVYQGISGSYLSTVTVVVDTSSNGQTLSASIPTNKYGFVSYYNLSTSLNTVSVKQSTTTLWSYSSSNTATFTLLTSPFVLSSSAASLTIVGTVAGTSYDADIKWTYVNV